ITSMFDKPMSYTSEPMILKCSVSNHLRVETTIVGIVDLFGHESVQCATNGMRGFIQLNLERGRCLLGPTDICECCGDHYQQRKSRRPPSCICGSRNQTA